MFKNFADILIITKKGFNTFEHKLAKPKGIIVRLLNINICYTDLLLNIIN